MPRPPRPPTWRHWIGLGISLAFAAAGLVLVN